MASKLGLWISICLIALQGFGQSYVIRGVVTDLGEEVRIAHVNIQIEGSLRGVSSDMEGGFKIAVERFPIVLRFSHVSYIEKEIRLYRVPSSPLIVRLEEKVTHLREFTLYSGPVVNLLKDEPLYVWDYEFHPDGILLLGSIDKNQWNQRVMLMSEKGDTILSDKLSRPRSLFKDCLGFYHLLTDKTAYQLETDCTSIRLEYPSPVGEFVETMQPLVGGKADRFIVQRNYLSNQVLVYYVYDTKTRQSKVLKEIRNEEGLMRLKDRARLESMPGYTEADKRFEDMCFYAPMYAPLFVLGDSLIILNFLEGLLEVYDFEGVMKSQYAIDFHQRQGWDHNIILDQTTNKLYAVGKRSGMTSLWEIDMSNGQVKKDIPIPDLPLIEKVKVEGGQVYFLYQGGNVPFKQLYRMSL